jgi:CRISPR-associated protein Cmr4
MKDCSVLGDALTIAGKVVFEDLDFTTGPPDADLRTFATRLGELLFPEGSADPAEWRQSLLDRICLVHDDIMSFLLDTATEVSAHIRLSPETKTVERGALWYQESLPAESVLAGITVAANVKATNGRSERSAEALLDHVAGLAASLVQLGVKATVGQGTCFVRIAGGRP